MPIRVMSDAEVRDWLLRGGEIAKDREGVRSFYRVVVADAPPGTRLPEIPDALVARYLEDGWLESPGDPATFGLSEEGRRALG